MLKASEAVPDVARYGDGALQSRGFTLDGEMHGAWEFIRKDCRVMRTGEFENGRQVGVWRTFDRAGRLVKETRFPIAPSRRASSPRSRGMASDRNETPPAGGRRRR